MDAPIELFLGKFEQLRQSIGNDASSIAWRSRADGALADLAADVVELAERIERVAARHYEKFIAHCPPQFGPQFRLYQEKFREHLTTATQVLRDARLASIREAIMRIAGSDNPKIRDIFEKTLRDVANQKTSLDFRESDVAGLIEGAIDDAIFLLDAWNDQDLFAEKIENAQLAQSAWRFLREELEIDVSEILRKWYTLRPIFIPTHVSRHHGETAENSLYAKLREACRAFVCGCNLSTIAMCRSILETTIERHYIHPGSHLAPRAGIVDKIQASTLPHIDKERFKKLVLFANKILHEDGALDRSAADHASTFLFSLKRLIEDAPVRGVS